MIVGYKEILRFLARYSNGKSNSRKKKSYLSLANFNSRKTIFFKGMLLNDK